ncbi:uncharacterized protein LY89DRAFT_714523 [Mollisia scopiformis]|uniref:BTB domain-containing protein n=1 Tax=Mollisia scopiformis TaxID=149040 RepID=A0A194XRX6_MOLSC|nr:uncharacterized protein LY89DRAFT_714523 [Mollisia scopiformis]KUJ22804.1 hypothetical protein LY89DRAFT_714523 [Mollisia scopiformis]
MPGRRGGRQRSPAPAYQPYRDTGTWVPTPNVEDPTAFPPLPGTLTSPRSIGFTATVALQDTVEDTAAKFSNLALTKIEKMKTPQFSNPSDMVTFIVGLKKEKFIVHKEFACKNSEVLRAAFNGPFLEGRTGTYILEDTSAAAFRMFTEFLYSGKITLHYHNLNAEDDLVLAEDEEHIEMCAQQDTDLIDLWLLADRFLMVDFQNQVIDHMKRIYQICGVMSSCQFRKIYDNTQEGSPLRRLVVDLCCWAFFADYIKDKSDKFPQDMLVDVAIAYRDAAPSNVITSKRSEIPTTDYHVKRQAS